MDHRQFFWKFLLFDLLLAIAIRAYNAISTQYKRHITTTSANTPTITA